ncbi:MAG: hypothetical protein KF788_08820 [Piscinibacter sp.]|nr:hypothetical protein [Piscinibacter sp.]
MTTLATYSFTQADVNPIPDPPWENPGGSVPLQVVSNAAVTTIASNDAWGLHVTGGITWPSEQWSEVILSAVGGRDCGPVVHGALSPWDGYMCTNFDGSNVYLYEIGAGGFANVANGAGAYVVGQPVRLESTNSGANKVLRALTSGVERCNYTDTSPRGNGAPGLFHYDGTSGTASWSGGDFAAGGSAATPYRSKLVQQALRHF